MTDEQISKKLAYYQARGEPGAAQARAFVAGGWLPRPDWGLIYKALLKLAHGRFHYAVVQHPGEQACQLLLEALRAGEAEDASA